MVWGRDCICPHRIFFNRISCQHFKKRNVSHKKKNLSFQHLLTCWRTLAALAGISTQQQPAGAECRPPWTGELSPSGHNYCCIHPAFVPTAKLPSEPTGLRLGSLDTEPKTGILVQVIYGRKGIPAREAG